MPFQGSLWFVPGVFALFALGMKLLVSTNAPPSRPAGRVVGVVGRMGSGKSLYCVREIRKRLKRKHRIATNFALELPEKWQPLWSQFTGWEDLAVLRNCTIFIDEVQLYAPSSRTFQLPLVARYALSSARKRGCDVFWITQHPQRVTSTLRDLTGEIILCKTVFGFLHMAKSYEPEDWGKKGRHIWVLYYRPSKRLIELYNTVELILPAKEVDAEGLVAALLAKRVPS